MTLSGTFAAKLKYDEEVSMSYFNQNFIDFETQFAYGILNSQSQPMLVRTEQLKPLDANEEITALSFVANAFGDMYSEIQQKVVDGNWEAASLIPGFKVRRAAENLLNEFDTEMRIYFSEMAEQESQSSLGILYKNRNLSSFKSFLDIFENFAFTRKYDFSTLNGFVLRQRNIFYSGAAIEFSDLSKNDFETLNSFVTDPGFKRYMLLAKKYGFLVNRNIPWMLVANFNSAAMQKYASATVLKEVPPEGILKRFFINTNQMSFDLFCRYLISFYNSVAQSEPKYQYLVHDLTQCKGYKTIEVLRSPIATEAEIKTIIGDFLLRFYLLYFEVRWREGGNASRFYPSARKLFIETLKADSVNPSQKRIVNIIENLCSSVRRNIKSPYMKGAESAIKFKYSFQAQEAALRLGCKGFHQMPDGDWMPCATHEEYVALTKPVGYVMPKTTVSSVPAASDSSGGGSGGGSGGDSGGGSGGGY